MKQILSFPISNSIQQQRSVVCTVLALSLASAMGIPSRAQTPAIQYVPVVNTVAGGATTSTLCSNATDTIGDGCIATLSILSGPTTGDSDAAGNFYGTAYVGGPCSGLVFRLLPMAPAPS